MSRLLTRIVAALLVPCLPVNPVILKGSADSFSRPRFQFSLFGAQALAMQPPFVPGSEPRSVEGVRHAASDIARPAAALPEIPPQQLKAFDDIKNTHAWNFLSVLGLEDVALLSPRTPRGRRSSDGTTVLRIDVPALVYAKDMTQGQSLLQHELAEEALQFDLLYNIAGNLIGIFPVMPPELMDRYQGAEQQHAEQLRLGYFDLSPYYFEQDEQATARWEALAIAHQADEQLIQNYLRGVTLPMKRVGSASSYFVGEADPDTGHLDISAASLEGPNPFERLNAAAAGQRVVFPVLPTVFPPTLSSDKAYHLSIWGKEPGNDSGETQGLKLGDKVLLVGPGSGFDSWLSSLITKTEICVSGLNPFEIANTEIFAKLANFKVHARVFDNIADKLGQPAFPGQTFDWVLWNMPHLEADFPSRHYRRFSDSHDGDPEGLILQRFLWYLSDVLSAGGRSRIWNAGSDYVQIILRMAQRADISGWPDNITDENAVYTLWKAGNGGKIRTPHIGVRFAPFWPDLDAPINSGSPAAPTADQSDRAVPPRLGPGGIKLDKADEVGAGASLPAGNASAAPTNGQVIPLPHDRIIQVGRDQMERLGQFLAPFLPDAIPSEVRQQVSKATHPLFQELLALAVKHKFALPLILEMLESPTPFARREVWQAAQNSCRTLTWELWERFIGDTSGLNDPWFANDFLILSRAWPVEKFKDLSDVNKEKILNWLFGENTGLNDPRGPSAHRALEYLMRLSDIIPVASKRRAFEWLSNRTSFLLSDPLLALKKPVGSNTSFDYDHARTLELSMGGLYDALTETERSELLKWLFSNRGLWSKEYLASSTSAGIADAVYGKLTGPEMLRIHSWLLDEEASFNTRQAYSAMHLMRKAYDDMSDIDKHKAHRWALTTVRKPGGLGPDYERVAAGELIANKFRWFSRDEKREFLAWCYGRDTGLRGQMTFTPLDGEWLVSMVSSTSNFLKGSMSADFREWLFGEKTGLQDENYYLRLAALQVVSQRYPRLDEFDKARFEMWLLGSPGKTSVTGADEPKYGWDELYTTEAVHILVRLYRKLEPRRQRRLLGHVYRKGLELKYKHMWALEDMLGAPPFGGPEFQRSEKREAAVLFFKLLHKDLPEVYQQRNEDWLAFPSMGLRHINFHTRISASNFIVMLHGKEIKMKMRKADRDLLKAS